MCACAYFLNITYSKVRHFWKSETFLAKLFMISILFHSNFHKIHILKFLLLTKFTFSKSDVSQNAHFQNLIFQPHIWQINVSQTSISREFLDKKLVLAPLCVIDRYNGYAKRPETFTEKWWSRQRRWSTVRKKDYCLLFLRSLVSPMPELYANPCGFLQCKYKQIRNLWP